jgi:hypothetical protein
MSARKLELHYFLENNSHSMSAFTQNRCEAEFLALTLEVMEICGIDSKINIEAIAEGGIRKTYDFLNNNAGGIMALTGGISTVIAIITLILQYQQQPDKELVYLDKELKRLQIEKLRNELNYPEEINQEIVNHTKTALNNNKVITRRSNFFKELNANQEVKKLGVTNLDERNVPAGKETIIERSSFLHYIQRSNKLKTITDENAEIEIVSPVLNNGRTKWKGIYENEIIAFNMNDRSYKNAVLRKEKSFAKGHKIVCVLDIHRELNEAGEIVIKNYTVETVLSEEKGGNFQDTDTSKNYRFVKDIKDRQLGFDF